MDQSGSFSDRARQWAGDGMLQIRRLARWNSVLRWFGRDSASLRSGRYRVSLYAFDDERRKNVLRELSEVGAVAVEKYDAIIDASVDETGLERLREKGLEFAQLAQNPLSYEDAQTDISDIFSALQKGDTSTIVAELELNDFVNPDFIRQVSRFARTVTKLDERRIAVEVNGPGLKRLQVLGDDRGTLHTVRQMRDGGVAVEARRAASGQPWAQVVTPGNEPEAPLEAEMLEGAVALELWFDVVFENQDAAQQGLDALENMDGVVVQRAAGSRVRVVADADVMASVRSLPHVQHVARYTPANLCNETARRIIGLTTPAPANDWNGTGEIVAIFDSGCDVAHAALGGRVIESRVLDGMDDQDVNGHGTHIAATIVGDATAMEPSSGVGMAPGARVVSVTVTVTRGTHTDVEPPLDFQAELQAAYDRGARIVNLSWERQTDARYDMLAMDLDVFLYDHPDMLVCVAAGNGGEMPTASGWVATVGSPAAAKNVLTVGAGGTGRTSPGGRPVAPTDRAALSAIGPPETDQIKPEILGPGKDLLSARSQHALPARYQGLTASQQCGWLGGTSMACGAVSGAAAVVREFLRDSLGVTNPSAALLRATLLSATRRPAAPPANLVGTGPNVGYPDFARGFGHLDLTRILTPRGQPAGLIHLKDVASDDGLITRSTTGVPGVHRYLIDVADQNEEVVIVLSWTDVPGKGIQQNLNLWVKDGAADKWGNAELAFLRSPANRGEDRRNNNEMVRIAPHAPGTKQIFVLAASASFGKQSYALAVSGTVNGGLRTV